MNVKACPDDKHLAAHLLGRLHGARAEQLDSHLQVCDSCVERALKLKPEDTLTSALGDGVVDLSGDESVVLEIIEKAGALHAIVETSTGYETSSGQPNSGNSSATDISFLSPPQESDEIGRLGSYRVLEVLGIGGMGVVFRAEDPHLKRQIALKAMKPELAATPSAKERFLREARAAAAIEHDNIVTIYQVGEDRGVPFLAMRFLRGESLQTRLKRENRLSIKEVLRIGRETASGLAAAHARGLIHRDIKPDNMWLESRSHLRSDDEQGGGDSQELKVTSQSMEDVTRAKADSQLTHEAKDRVDRVKIVDFGLVRADDDIELTKTGVVMGTPRYMSPEQAQGQPVDHRSDLFSLGSVLYHLTTGEGPFDRDNMPSTLMAVIREDPDRIENHRSDAPRELKGLIVRLLEKNPDDRPQSAAEVVAAVREIESILAEESKRAKTKRKPKVRPVKAPRAKKSGTRRRVVIGTAIVAPLLIVLGIVLLLRTPNGTLRVEVNDENLEVLVDGVQITLTDKKWAGKQKARKHRLAIKLGNQMLNIDSPTLIEVDDGEVERHLSVQLNGVDLSSNEFTVVRDGENVLTIAYEKVRIETVGQSDYEAVELKGTITPGDGWVDLLAAVDVRRDTTGSWRKDAGEFVGYGGLMLPVRPSGSFEWEVGFTHAATGDGLIDVLIPHPHGRVYARVTGETGLRLSAPADSEEESRSLIAAPAVSRGEPHTLKLTCDTRDDKTSIAILIDDKLWAEWAGDFRALTSRVPPMQHPFIHTGRQSITIRTARLRMLDGEARSDARAMPQQLDDLATGTWVPLFRSAEDLKLEGATKDRATWKDGIIDVVNTTKKTSYWSGVVKALAAPRGRNVILRAEVYFVYGHFASMSLSGSEEDIVRVSTTKSGYVLHRRDIRFNRDTNTLVPQSRKSRKGFRDVAIALIDGHAGLYLDGKLVLHRYGWSDEKRLPIIQAYDIGYQPGHAQFRNVRLMVLDNEATAETPSTAIAPFNATTAQERQKAWADFLGLPVEKEFELPGGEKMTFMLIPPGEFMMGSTDEELASFLGDKKAARAITSSSMYYLRDEVPQHRVRNTRPFYLGMCEVTQAQWQALMGSNPSNFQDHLTHPVEQVSWEDIQPFLKKLNEGLSATEPKFALPTEAQWEFACRAGTIETWHIGDSAETLNEVAWFAANSYDSTHPVGRLKPNSFGLHDMHGNVGEWCADWHAGDYYSNTPSDDPAGPLRGSHRVVRGGGCIEPAAYCRSAFRTGRLPDNRHLTLGFRLAMTIDPTQLTPASPTVADNDRRAAEYIVSVGGRLVTDRSDQWTDVVPDSPFRLKGVSLAGRTVTDEELAAFQGCTELETLDLNRASVTDAGVIHFKNCKKLKELTLGTIVTNEGLANFQDCDRLERLMLICSTQKITDAGLAFFKNCKELNHLHLHHAYVGDAGLSHLKDCQKLAHLHLDRSNVTDTGLAQLKNWKELSTLVLSFTEVSDEGLAHLKDYPSLTSFSLMDAPHVSDAGLAHLQECKGLTIFILRRSPGISADMVARLKEALPNCRVDWDGETSVVETQSAQGSSHVHKAGVPVNLLPLINLERDVIHGKWQLDEGQLQSSIGWFNRLHLPLDVPAQYQIDVQTEGDAGMNFGLLVGGSRVLATLDSMPGLGYMSGLQQVDGKNLQQSSTLRKGRVLAPGKHSVLASVTKAKAVGEFRILVEVDGKSVIDWTGKPNRLSNIQQFSVPSKSQVALGSNDRPLRFTKISILPLGQHPPAKNSN